MGWKYKYLFIFCYILISTISGAPTQNFDQTNNEQINLESTTTTTTTITTPTSKINHDSTPISDLIQLQTDAIKKILSTAVHTKIPQNSAKPNCEEIETEIKESLEKSTGQEIYFQEYQIQDVDNPEEKQTVKEKSVLPVARNLFNLYRRSDEEMTTTIAPVSSTGNYNYAYTENQNIILIPCVKYVVPRPDGTRRFDEDVNQNQHTDHILTTTTEAPVNQNSYFLEKVFSPNGYFLYYMYKLRNTNPYPTDYLPPSSTVASTTSSTTTTVPTTTANAVQEPVYAEKLKFVIQMPYTEPEPVVPYNYRFDQYAYYPPDMQPAYVNAPAQYKPAYHMIRTLVIPNEYLNSYVTPEQQQQQQQQNGVENATN